MSLNEILINIGLTKKEAAVYLATLELGDSPASDIAIRAKQNRVSTYDVLEKLRKRGFISRYTKKGVKYFSATDPDLIRTDVRQKYMDFKSSLPDLRRLHGKTSHPRVRYYEGIEGVKKVYTDTLTAKTELLNYADSKSIRDFWPNYDKEYVKERVKRKIYLRGISPRDEYGEKVVADNKKSHREIRLVKPGQFDFSNEINIYDDKISIISFGKDEILGMIIESPEIANTQRAIFTMAWQFAGNAQAA
jgi:HTH-type transcriptional regulator, sugar sensing transcriptional regulator